MEKTVRRVYLVSILLLVTLLMSGCEDPTKTKHLHTVIKIQKDDMIVVDYEGMVEEFRDKEMTHTSELYDKNATYVLFRHSMDIRININPTFKIYLWS